MPSFDQKTSFFEDYTIWVLLNRCLNAYERLHALDMTSLNPSQQFLFLTPPPGGEGGTEGAFDALI